MSVSRRWAKRFRRGDPIMRALEYFQELVGGGMEQTEALMQAGDAMLDCGRRPQEDVWKGWVFEQLAEPTLPEVRLILQAAGRWLRGPNDHSPLFIAAGLAMKFCERRDSHEPESKLVAGVLEPLVEPLVRFRKPTDPLLGEHIKMIYALHLCAVEKTDSVLRGTELLREVMSASRAAITSGNKDAEGSLAQASMNLAVELRTWPHGDRAANLREALDAVRFAESVAQREGRPAIAGFRAREHGACARALAGEVSSWDEQSRLLDEAQAAAERAWSAVQNHPLVVFSPISVALLRANTLRDRADLLRRSGGRSNEVENLRSKADSILEAYRGRPESMEHPSLVQAFARMDAEQTSPSAMKDWATVLATVIDQIGKYGATVEAISAFTVSVAGQAEAPGLEHALPALFECAQHIDDEEQGLKAARHALSVELGALAVSDVAASALTEYAKRRISQLQRLMRNPLRSTISRRLLAGHIASLSGLARSRLSAAKAIDALEWAWWVGLQGGQGFVADSVVCGSWPRHPTEDEYCHWLREVYWARNRAEHHSYTAISDELSEILELPEPLPKLPLVKLTDRGPVHVESTKKGYDDERAHFRKTILAGRSRGWLIGTSGSEDQPPWDRQTLKSMLGRNDRRAVALISPEGQARIFHRDDAFDWFDVGLQPRLEEAFSRCAQSRQSVSTPEFGVDRAGNRVSFEEIAIGEFDDFQQSPATLQEFKRLSSTVERLGDELASYLRSAVDWLNTLGVRELVVVDNSRAAGVPWSALRPEGSETALGEILAVWEAPCLEPLLHTESDGGFELNIAGTSEHTKSSVGPAISILQSAGLNFQSFSSLDEVENAVWGASVLRFVGHGHHSAWPPDFAGLLLDDAAPLAQRDALGWGYRDLRSAPLSNCARVEVWACEAARSVDLLGIAFRTNEPLSVDSALLLAGARNVVAARWPTPVIPTALIALYFREECADACSSSDLAVALATSQRRYRSFVAQRGAVATHLITALQHQPQLHDQDALRLAFRQAIQEIPLIDGSLNLESLLNDGPNREQPVSRRTSRPSPERRTRRLLAPLQRPWAWAAWRILSRDPWR